MERAGTGLGCDDVLESLTDYLEEALPAGRRRRVADHLGACPACSGCLGQIRATIAVLGCLRHGVVPAPVLNALWESFLTS
ncbi:zf-HC2 domain-containing protein [Nonomuraea sp. K274]|uniref:Zf-HC2 domain-containing protein n=1 Tax=Nonomuraea cypriaca TaxID=1187855 RepID=A0A931F701_9ACTN|nr:zf-HC2 domain-containing protein [Nonomuraea cypriaca]MBF8193838.1 zf-HC2 domain-containing protein [Nonomuraea cypriaca]